MDGADAADRQTVEDVETRSRRDVLTDHKLARAPRCLGAKPPRTTYDVRCPHPRFCRIEGGRGGGGRVQAEDPCD
jgi:hypothetical protein